MNNIKNILLTILGPLFLSPATVTESRFIAPKFKLLKLKCRKFKKANWKAGQKIQVKLGESLMRSYTPSKWNQKVGEFETLVYIHQNGPGSNWAEHAEINSKAIILGPRASLTLAEDTKNVLFFGDETTFGLAHAIEKNYLEINFTHFFESQDTQASKTVFDYLALTNYSHFSVGNEVEISKEIAKKYSISEGKTSIVLSGKQQSIKTIRAQLLKLNIPASALIIKVYWGWKDDPEGKLKAI